MLPLLAMGISGEKLNAATEAIKSLGAHASAPVMTFTYMPTIIVGKGKEKKEIPDPHFPTGMQVNVPAWLLVVSVFLGIPIGILVMLYLLDTTKRFLQSKEKDPVVRLSRASTGWFAEASDSVKNAFKIKLI